MKQITNWHLASVADFEANGLLDTVTHIHVMSYNMVNEDGTRSKEFTIRRDDPLMKGKTYKQRLAGFFKWNIDNNRPVVMHNGIGYDAKLVKMMIQPELDEINCNLDDLMVIDTLATSWYLSPDRRLHGLDSFFEDYGIAKPPISDWDGDGKEFLDTMQHRCTEDVKINTALYEDHKERLIDMYTLAQHYIDNGQEIKDKQGRVEKVLNVGGTRISPDEWIPIDDMIGRSVDKAIDSILTFLMFKMDCAALQESTRWEVDVEHCRASLEKLEEIVLSAREGLAAVMPKVPKYVKKTEPKADKFKKNGERNSHWVRWDETMRQLEAGEKDPETGSPLVYIDKDDALVEGKQVYRVWNKNEDPNPGSPAQVKDFLFSKGWVPQTFKYEKDEVAFNAWIAAKPQGKANHRQWEHWKNSRPEERAIPQISVGGDDGKELCHSLIELAEEVPAIKVYADYKVAENRRNVLKGFFRDMEDGKWLKARIGGFTNTLRVQHRELVNLPGTDKPYGYDIRGSLIAGIKRILVGSDMSSLEDRVKHHFMLPHDPEYVATMQADDFDPHILMALIAKMITQEEFDQFKLGNKSANAKAARKKGKTTNYASVYNAGAAKIAQAAGVPVEEGKILHEAYWKLNWSVKAIADEQVVFKDARGNKWLVNPINGFCYSLRKESDRFSTLAQGTGSYFFDMWVDNILTALVEEWGIAAKRLTGSFHDECIICMRDTEENRAKIAKIIKDAVHKVNKDFGLRRKLDCETQFGDRYSDIH
jgi:hypothetical protein